MVSFVDDFLDEFLIAQLKLEKPQALNAANDPHSIPLFLGKLKINVDAPICLGDKQIGLGCVIQDHEGIVQAVLSKGMCGNFTVEIAELLVVCESL